MFLMTSRLIAILLAVLVAGACSDDDAAGTTTGSSIANGATTTEGSATSSTVSGDDSGPGAVLEGDCSDVWPLEQVNAVLGGGFELELVNDAGTACAFVQFPGAVTLTMRTGGRTDFDLARAAIASAGAEVPSNTCDDSVAVESEAGVTIVEALDENSGYVFTATMSGIDGAVDKAERLLQLACDQA